MHEPLLSIVVPVFNAERFLPSCIEQLTNQGFKPNEYEIIFVDDKSTDDSAACCRALAEEYPQVSALTLPENKGAGAARNYGMDHAQGKYLYFFDADDELLPDMLMKHCQLMEEDELDVLFFAAELIYEEPELETTDPQDPRYFRRTKTARNVDGRTMFILQESTTNFCAQPCVQLSRLDYLRANHIRFPEGIVNEDNGFVMASILAAKRCSMIDEITYRYIVRRGTVTTSASKGLKRFQAHCVLSDLCLQHAAEAWQHGDAELAQSLSRLNTWFISCAREALLSLPPDSQITPAATESPMADSLYNGLYQPFFKQTAALAKARSDLAASNKELAATKQKLASTKKKLKQQSLSAEYRFGKKALSIPRAIKNALSKKR